MFGCGFIMNERIKKLAEQATKESFPINSIAFMERFAELIVLECAIIVGTMEEPHQDIAELVKQHFGVE